jgi:hypothetical protein
MIILEFFILRIDEPPRQMPGIMHDLNKTSFKVCQQGLPYGKPVERLPGNHLNFLMG